MTTLTQTQTLDRPCAIKVYEYIVTFINRETEQEESLTIRTLSERYVDVSREIAHQKVMRGLVGYELYETLDCNAPF